MHEADRQVWLDAFSVEKLMIVLGIVAGITKGCVEPNERHSLPHRWGEVRRFRAWADARHRAEDEMRVGMDDGGEFRPGALTMPALRRRCPKQALTCRVSRLVACTTANGPTSTKPCWRACRTTTA